MGAARVLCTMHRIRGRLAFVASLMLLVGCDHGTKYAAKAGLSAGPPHLLLGGVLDLRYVENTDVAFNLLRWIPEGTRMPILIATGAFALLGLLVLLLHHPPRSCLPRLALLLITAGAFGNYLDRVVRGYVVDFVHLHHWPVFNVADVYLTVGAGLLLLSTMRVRRPLSAG
jgi:signal peptidase II